jgi:hypothetical protein
MNFKQSNWGDILDSESEMVLRAEERFGACYVNAVRFSELLARFVKSTRLDRMIFAMFLSQMRKHHVLADSGPSPRGGKPFGLRTGGELRVCKPFGVGATVNQNSKWEFQLN